jgi:hypothetical protein
VVIAVLAANRLSKKSKPVPLGKTELKKVVSHLFNHKKSCEAKGNTLGKVLPGLLESEAKTPTLIGFLAIGTRNIKNSLSLNVEKVPELLKKVYLAKISRPIIPMEKYEI